MLCIPECTSATVSLVFPKATVHFKYSMENKSIRLYICFHIYKNCSLELHQLYKSRAAGIVQNEFAWEQKHKSEATFYYDFDLLVLGLSWLNKEV